MTTIVTDGRSMAGDGLTLIGWTVIKTDTKKVRLANDGTIFGCTGFSEDGVLFEAWLNGGEKPKLSDEFAALCLSPDGTITWYSEKLIPLIETGPQAIGCGKDYALAAMDAGVSPKRAVEIASGRCVGSGGTITCLHLKADAEHEGPDDGV